MAEAYAQIEADLNAAIAGLPSENGVYATSHAAKALLAQVHFLKQEWQQAADLATEVIESGEFTLEQPESDSAFVVMRLPIGSSSSETIFSVYSTLAPTTTAPTNLCNGGNPPPTLKSASRRIFGIGLKASSPAPTKTAAPCGW